MHTKVCRKKNTKPLNSIISECSDNLFFPPNASIIMTDSKVISNHLHIMRPHNSPDSHVVSQGARGPQALQCDITHACQ